MTRDCFTKLQKTYLCTSPPLLPFGCLTSHISTVLGLAIDHTLMLPLVMHGVGVLLDDWRCQG